MSLFEDEVEETSWTMIMFLFSIVVGCFGYRFFGPDLESIKPTAPTTIKKKEEVEEVKREDTPEPEPIQAEAVVTETDAQESSDGSEFENISPSEIPPLSETVEKVEEIGAKEEEEEIVTAEPVKPVEVVEPDEEAEDVEDAEETENVTEEETEEDLVRTMDLGNEKTNIDAALDEYLGREVAEVPQDHIQENTQEDTQEDLIQKSEEKIQESQNIVEPTITPIDINQDIPKEEELRNESLKENVITGLLDDTVMTPHQTRKAVMDENLEDDISPMNLDETEKSVIEQSDEENIEEKIENVAQALIQDTISQVKSNEIKNIQDAAGDTTENKTDSASMDEDEKTVQAKQVAEIADLIEKTPGMAGEEVDVAQQAKMYLE